MLCLYPSSRIFTPLSTVTLKPLSRSYFKSILMTVIFLPSNLRQQSLGRQRAVRICILTLLIAAILNVVIVGRNGSLLENDAHVATSPANSLPPSPHCVNSFLPKCQPLSESDKLALVDEIKGYEKSKRFTDKIREVETSRPANLHIVIDAYLKQNVLRPGWSVLELGCAAGAMLQMVKKAYEEGIGEHKELVGVELVTGWVKFAQKYFADKEIHVYEGDITEFQLPEPFDKLTFDFVMLNDVTEHIQQHRYGCFFRQLREVTHSGSIVYMHTPNPQAQLVEAGQYYENILPHHIVIAGMASAKFELVSFEQDVESACGGSMSNPGALPKNLQNTKCNMNGYPKYYHALFRRIEDELPIFDLK